MLFMDEFIDYNSYDEYEETELSSSDLSPKHDNYSKKDECGKIKIYTRSVHIHINCKHCKY